MPSSSVTKEKRFDNTDCHLADFKHEGEFSTTVKPFIGLDDQLEVEEVIRIRKFGFARFRQLQLVDVFRNSKL
jgi:hypothetical protein